MKRGFTLLKAFRFFFEVEIWMTKDFLKIIFLLFFIILFKNLVLQCWKFLSLFLELKFGWQQEI